MDTATSRGLVIRQATRADVPVLLTLIRGLAEYEKLTDTCVATEADIADVLFGEGVTAEALLAEQDGEPVGFAFFFHNFSTFLGRRGIYIEDIFVKPERRGGGVGKALLLHVVRLANQRGCGRVEWSCLDWNEPAIGFYKRMGAQQLDEWSIFRLTGSALERLGT
jgi:GNAT superfamily N-acetyltransferase